jgi:methyl-accepting chemotaxis protein
MKIRNKLILMVGIFLGAFLLGVGFYLFSLISTNELEREATIISKYAQVVNEIQANTNSMTTGQLVTQIDAFDSALKRHDDLYSKFKSIKRIPKIDPESARLMKTIVSLKALNSSKLVSLSDDAKELLAQCQALSNDSDRSTVSLFDFIGKDIKALAKERTKPADQVDVLFSLALSRVSESVQQIGESFSIQVKNANELNNRTAARVSRDRVNGSLISFLVLFLGMAGGASLLFLTANGWAGAFIKFERHLSRMSEGKLNEEVTQAGADEIGDLAKHINSFTQNISGALSSIQQASDVNREASQKLAQTAESSVAAAHEIQAEADTIQARMNRMNEMTGKAMDGARAISEEARVFKDSAKSQDAQVESTGATVSQMLASINSVIEITSQESAASERMVKEAENGGLVIDEAFSRVASIGAGVDKIQEMVTLIEEIASRTNLLAMNAAIEAAHAGDAGRGFAVVAEEIRRLAENSQESSKGIGQRTQGIIEDIKAAEQARGLASDSFKGISERITEVSRAIERIYSMVGEMKTGSMAIQGSIAELRQRSAQISRESEVLGERSELSFQTMEELQSMANDVNRSISGIAEGLKEISSSVLTVNELASSLERVGDTLDREVHAFDLKAAIAE